MIKTKISYRPFLNGLLSVSLLLLVGCSSSNQSIQKKSANDDRVDIGYGRIDKSSVAGSVTTIDGADARAKGARSLADMLRGRVAGVVVTEGPGGSLKVRIRGARSFKGNNDPLFVLDGMPLMNVTDGMLYDLNPEDIESISVLKDIGSTSLYGMRGANGVILITTRMGR
jgi:TonB-dependent SusC/RagA subfamily outer membrane receptor